MMLDARTIDGLYRQDEVDEAIARGTAVCLVETAKEADELWSREVPATCCPGGSKKWRPEYSRMLSNADVVLVQSNGNSGRIDQIGETLHSIARGVWFLDSKSIQADSADEIWTIIQAAPRWVPAATTKQPFLAAARPLVYYADFGKKLKLDWIVKGFLAKEHNSYVIGPPGSGKSTMMSSVATYLGAGKQSWHGFKINKKYAAVIFAIERGALVQKRIWCECQREGFGEVPVAISGGTLSIMDPSCVNQMVGTILRAEDALGMEVGLTSIDTFSKALAAGNGDENLARDQNIAWGHMRRVHEVMARWHSIHINAVGHTGKDESRGARGSNAATGDNDVLLQIKTEGLIKSVSIEKANELPEGPFMRFKMEPYNTGQKDEDGNAAEVWITSGETINAAPVIGVRLTPNQQTLFSILHGAGRAGLSTEEWNNGARDIGLGVKRPADLYDVRDQLKSKKLVRESAGRWFVDHKSEDPK